ncbi:MAG: hypothetical protein ACXW50_02570 [Candidatus Binatia bacterium]
MALSLRLKIDFAALHLPIWKVTTQAPSQWRFGERAVVEVSVEEELGQAEWVEMPGGSGSFAGVGQCIRAAVAQSLRWPGVAARLF